MATERSTGNWPRFIVACLAGLILTGGSGCMSAFHPVHQAPHLCLYSEPLPACCREHVYIFFVHGTDPLDYANLCGLRDYCNALGYCQTYYGQFCHGQKFEKEIRRINCRDPQARFVLAGFSAGANVVRDMAHALHRDGITIDLIVYLAGNTLKNTPENRPPNAIKVVHILATEQVWKGHAIEGAENHKLPDARHFGTPSHAETLDVFAYELAVAASHVEIQQEAPAPTEPPPPANAAPTPRPVVRAPEQPSDAWDFLKPTAYLAPVGSTGPAAGTAPPTVAQGEADSLQR